MIDQSWVLMCLLLCAVKHVQVLKKFLEIHEYIYERRNELKARVYIKELKTEIFIIEGF